MASPGIHELVHEICRWCITVTSSECHGFSNQWQIHCSFNSLLNGKFEVQITSPLWGDATGERWNPLTKSQCLTLKASVCHDAIMINCHVTVKCIGLQPIAKFMGYTFASGEFVSHWLEYWLIFVFEVMLFKAATFNSQAHKATFNVAPGNPTPWRRVPVTTIQKYFGWSDPI